MRENHLTKNFLHKERDVKARVDIDADVRYEGPTRSRGKSGLDGVKLDSIKSMFENGGNAPELPKPMFSLNGIGMGLAGSSDPSVVTARDAKGAASFDGVQTASTQLGASGTASLGAKKETAAQRRRRLKKGRFGAAAVGQQTTSLTSMTSGSLKAQQEQKPPTHTANL